MKVILCRITLEEHLLATRLGGDPNSAVSYPFIPGSMLRGAAVQKASSEFPGGLDAARESDRAWFFSGQTRFLNAYLLCGEKRSQPIPRSWQITKENQSTIYDFAVETPDQSATWKSVDREFYIQRDEDAKIEWVSPEFQIVDHNARNRRMGRAVDAQSLQPGEDTGAVYRIMALASDQVFEAPVICESDKIYKKLLLILNGTVKLGGSRTGGYGLARLESRPAPDDWREAGDSPIQTDGQFLTITFLSDGLLRSSAGMFSADPQVVCQVIEQKLGASLVLKDAYSTGRWIGGFNRKWGLPLPQALAIRMGSTFKFKAAGLKIDQLTDLEKEGLGERIAEGFGRIAVNLHDETCWHVLESRTARPKPGTVSFQDNSLAQRTAERMAARLLETNLDEALTYRSHAFAKNIQTPQPGQLNRLILILRNIVFLSPQDGCARMQDYLNNLGKRKVTRQSFEEDRVEGKKLLEWLKYVCNDQNLPEIWNLLGTPPINWPSIGGVKVQDSVQLQYQTTIRFLIAILGLATKFNQNHEED